MYLHILLSTSAFCYLCCNARLPYDAVRKATSFGELDNGTAPMFSSAVYRDMCHIETILCASIIR